MAKRKSSVKVVAAEPGRKILVESLEGLEARIMWEASISNDIRNLFRRTTALETLANDYSDFLCGDGFDGKKEPKKSKWGQIIAWLGRKDA